MIIRKYWLGIFSFIFRIKKLNNKARQSSGVRAGDVTRWLIMYLIRLTHVICFVYGHVMP